MTTSLVQRGDDSATVKKKKNLRFVITTFFLLSNQLHRALTGWLTSSPVV